MVGEFRFEEWPADASEELELLGLGAVAGQIAWPGVDELAPHG